MTTKSLRDVHFSVLDLAPIVEGGTAGQSLRNSLDLAQHAENWGYTRYWVAEHHSMPGIASSATSVVIGYLAGGTSRIRVGSGGIMLPNHAPLVVAEQFGTLESLYPGRIDLGLGRAPGTDQVTARALRRGQHAGADDFPEQVAQLQAYFHPEGDPRRHPVHAVPGEGLDIPIWLLGSSDFSAQLASYLGLPFAFASHFAPNYILPALQLYRDHFRPSEGLSKPYVMIGVNVIAADTDEEARRLATSMQQQALSLYRGNPGRLKPPIDNIDEVASELEKRALDERGRFTAVGSPDTIAAQLVRFAEETKADEMIVSAQIFNHDARLRSYELLSGLFH